MNCDSCKSERVAKFSAKCSDRSSTRLGSNEEDGYVPYDIGLGGGDYVKMDFCMDCGKIQGKFPLAPAKIEEDKNTCMECGGEIREDDSPGVFVHAGDDGYDLDDNHVAIPENP